MSETWPAELPYQTRRGYPKILAPHRPLDRTDMEDGPQRRRAVSSKSIATIQFPVRLTNAQFDTFREFVRVTLVGGSLDFTMQVWTGAAYEERTCAMAQDWQDDPVNGLTHLVMLTLDVEDY